MKGQSRYGALTMGARQFTGLVTNRAPFRDAMVAYLIAKFYGGSRNDSIWDGLNREITTKLTDKRAPGSVTYNSQTFDAINSWYAWKYIQNGSEILRVMADCTDSNVYDATGPSTKDAIWQKAPNAGPTRFLGVGTELFFDDAVEQKKVVESGLTWAANTLFDGAATSDTPLGDFIIDTNGNVQQAVGGFTLLISFVSLVNNVLTLTLETAQLADPSGTPTGTSNTSGGALSAGTHYIRICGVDDNGNVTEAGNESVAVTTTGTTSSILWTWPAISGAVSYRIYVTKVSGAEGSYFTSSVNSLTQTKDTSAVTGVPPVTNATSTDVPDNLFQMVGVELALDGLTSATFLNGQTVTIASVLYNGSTGGMYSNQVTVAFGPGFYPNAPDTGTASSGSGITGGSAPAWDVTLAAVTQDGGAQWINRGPQVQNWGIATPATAPTIFQTAAPQTYPAWQPNTVYWRSGVIDVVVSGVLQLFQITTPGKTGTSPPTWVTTTPGVSTTTDGTAVWTYMGVADWAATTAYAKNALVLGASYTSKSVFQAQNGGISGTDQTKWTNVTAGTLVQDGSILWKCLGFVADYVGNGWPFNPSQNVAGGAQIVDSNGYFEQVQDNPLNSGGSGATAVVTATGSGGRVVSIGVTNGGTGYTQVEVIIDNPVVSGDPPALATATIVDGIITSITMIAEGLGYSGFPSVTIRPLNTQWVSGAVEPDWEAQGALTSESLSAPMSGGKITATPLALNIAQVNNANYFSPFQTLVLSGFVTATYLNGTWTNLPLYPPSAPLGDQPIGIAFQINQAAGTFTDTGVATLLEPAMWLNTGPYAPLGTAPVFWVYSYGNSVTAHVGTASLQSANVTLLANNQADVAGFGSADPQVDTIWIFRPAEGETTAILVDKIANPGGGVPWNYLDTIPDISVDGGPELIAQIAAPTDHANDPPPANMTASAYHMQRGWAISGNKVVYSGVAGQAVGAGIESWDPENNFPFVSQPIKLVPITVQQGGLLVLTTGGIYIILGTGDGTGNTIAFYDTIYYDSVSISSYNAVTKYNQQVFVMETNGKVSAIACQYPFNPQTGYDEVSLPIGDQFLNVTTGGINAPLYNPATAYVSWNLQNTAETALYVADGSVGWFRMSVVSPPESGLLWSPRRGIVGGTSAVQSVETTPGAPQLLIGPPAGTPGPILARDATGTVWTDRGQTYPAWDAKGVNLLCSTGQWAEVAHVSAKSAAVGTRPQVSVLLSEIEPSSERPYINMTLDDKHEDPPLTPKSISYFSDRYVVLAKNGESATGDCVLTKFDYGSQAVGDELLDWGIFADVTDERQEGAAK